jgi:predicted peptidase
MRPTLCLTSQLLDALLATGSVDDRRVYVAGVSLGPMGTFDLLSRRPGFFAGAIAVCGGGNLEATAGYAPKLPIWVFHGSLDPVVHVDYSRQMVKALQTNGAQVRYTEYPGVAHNSWNKALAEPELLPWLFAQRKAA